VDPTVAAAAVGRGGNFAGTDDEGLVWGYRFNEDGSAEPLSPSAAMQALNERLTWVWLHFDLVDNRVRAALTGCAGLPPEAVDILLGNEERQQLHAIDDVIAGVVADFERADTLDPRRMVTWRFCMAPHAFISARCRPLESMSRLHNDLQSGRRFPGVTRLFDAIIHAFASAMSGVAQDLSTRLDEVEDELLDSREAGDYETLGTVRRGAVRLRRQSMPLRGMLHHLIEERPTWFDDDAVDDCTHVARRLDSLTADLAALQERARALQDEMASRQAQQTNQRLMLLSVFTAGLVPPTLISGLFGMNVEGLPFKDNPNAFLYTVGIMMVAVAVLLFALRRIKLI
jgi:zinc transporter